MTIMTRFLVLLILATILAACAQNPPKSASGKRLELETVYHGPMRAPTYLYHEVD